MVDFKKMHIEALKKEKEELIDKISELVDQEDEIKKVKSELDQVYRHLFEDHYCNCENDLHV